MQLFLTKNLKIIIIVSDWLGKTAGQSVQIAVNQPKRVAKKYAASWVLNSETDCEYPSYGLEMEYERI